MANSLITLQNSSWLAKRLGISISTLERLRSRDPDALPRHILVGSRIRYDEQVVDKWLTEKLAVQQCNAKSEGEK